MRYTKKNPAKRYKWAVLHRGKLHPIWGDGAYDETGGWMKVSGPIETCVKGFHVFTKKYLTEWFSEGKNFHPYSGRQDELVLLEVEVYGNHKSQRDTRPKLFMWGQPPKECWKNMRIVRRITGAERNRLMLRGQA